MIDPDGMEAQDIWGRNRFDENNRYIPPHERGSKDGNEGIDNDHFDKNGNFLYTDKEKEQNVIIHTDNGLVNLGEYEVKSKENAIVASKILNYYYKLLFGSDINGLRNKSLSIFSTSIIYWGGNPDKLVNPLNFNNANQKLSLDPLSNTMYFPSFRVTHEEKTITAFFTDNYKMGQIFNQKWNLMSALSHEYGHIKYKNNESRAYFIQTLDPIFILTTPEFKKAIFNQSKSYGLPK
ncbi:MAG: hypothetical protein ACRC8Z_00075 [Empedobacter falsenii]